MNPQATNLKNSPVSAIIAGVMRDATTEGNRQAELVVAMFGNEITYSTSNILHVFNATGRDKTARVDSLLANASDEFDAILDRLATIKDLPKEDKRKAAYEADGLNRKARAARIMFERALKSVYWLRMAGCKAILTNKIGVGALKAKMPDQESEGEYVNQMYTASELVNAGDKVLAKATGKEKEPKEASAKNPAADSIANASKALSAVLTSIGKEGKRKPITDFDDKVSKQLEDTLHELFAMKFFDGNRFDKNTFAEWMAQEFKMKADGTPVQQPKPKTEGEQKVA